MPEPINKKLYEEVKAEASKKFKAPSGIYRSSWIVREYKKRGGKYKGKKSSKKGTTRWYKEKWVDLNRPIRKNGKIVGYKPCGRKSANKKSGKYPLCRPSKRVSKKTPKTYKELSKKSIRKAKHKKSQVKHKSNVKFGGGKPQFYGKASVKRVKVPSSVKNWAKKAFELRKLGFKGATSTGWKRAKQLATKDSIPIEDFRYMRNWYARHIVTSYPTFKKWVDAGKPKTKEWHNKRGIISWVTWGANPGWNWVNRKSNVDMLNNHFNKNYKASSKKL